MKIIKAFIRQMKIHLKKKGDNPDNYEFVEVDEKKIKISKFGNHKIIDLSDSNNVKIDEINELIQIDNENVVTTSSNETINIDIDENDIDENDYVDIWIKDALNQLELYDKNEPINEVDYGIKNPDCVMVPVDVNYLRFETIDVVSTSGHILKAYNVSSRANGLDILLVPGYLSSHIIYTNILTDGWIHNLHNVYIFDPRGQGDSEKPDIVTGNYESANQRADDICSVIKKLNLKNIVLVGHSYGWLQIGDYINKYGQQDICGLICINGLAEMNVKYFNSIYLSYLTTFTDSVKLNYTDKINDIANLVQNLFMNDPGNHFRVLLTADFMSVDQKLRLPILAHEKTDYVSGNNSLWSNVTIPTLIQWGENDNVINIQSIKDLYRVIPRSKLKLYNAKHYPFIDEHHIFMCDMRKFLYDLLNSIKKVDNN